MRTRFFALSLAVAATLPAVACSATTTKTMARSPSGDTTAAAPDQSTLAGTYGAVRDVTFPSELNGGYLFATSITPDGAVIANLIGKDHVQREVVRFDPRTRAVRTLHRYSSQGDAFASWQATEAVSDDRFVAWVDGTSNGDFLDWRLWVHDLTTGRSHIAARNNRLKNGSPCTSELDQVALRHHVLWWSACTGTTERSLDVATFTMRLGHDAKPVLWRRATSQPHPTATGIYARVPDRRVGAPEDAAIIANLDASGRQVKTAVDGGRGEHIAYWTASDELVGWTSSPYAPSPDEEPQEEGDSYTTHVRWGGKAFEFHDGDGLISPTAEGPFLAWASDRDWLFDARIGKKIRVSSGDGDGDNASIVSNGYLLWGRTSATGGRTALFKTTYHLVPLTDLKIK